MVTLTSPQLFKVLAAFADAAAHCGTMQAECTLLDKPLLAQAYSERADEYSMLYRELTRNDNAR